MTETKSLYTVEHDYTSSSPWVRPDRPWEKLYPEGVPRTVKYPEIPVHYLGRESARSHPHNLAIYFVQEERKYTYRELMHFSDKIATGLADMGVKKGDGVGIYMTNAPEFIFTVYGISQNGAIAVPINPMLKAPDIEHIIKDSGILTTIICSSILFPNIEQVRGKDQIDNIIVSGGKKPGTASLEELVEKYPAKPPEVKIDPKEDLCVLLYTGGTTGAPKGVMLTHYNITTNVYQMAEMERISTKEDISESCITVLPMCHAFGFSQVQLYVAQRALMILYNGFNPEDIMKYIELYRTENFVGIPLMFQMLVNDPNFEKYDLSSLYRVISGAAPLPQELFRKWKEVVGSEVGQGYGLSEASPTTHMVPTWLSHSGDSIGLPVLDTDVRIMDAETGTQELQPGEVGELTVRGPQVMQGYWKQPEKTKDTIKGGWLYTGDLAYMDEQGRFFISGRQSDMIKYKGYKVLPDEVEDYLYKHPAVLECAVIGVPDPEIGETIKAFVVIRDDYKGKITEGELMDWAKSEMAGYKWPRQVQFIDAIPRTPIGKVFRRALREQEVLQPGS
ncbi:MAG: AMP-binding protein [Deltaproteobacteria bacterium]|nr:AMP-binding protein [Deltaproteobacteria bacterium]